MTGGVNLWPSCGPVGGAGTVMSDFDDDTQHWEDPEWVRTGEVPVTPTPARRPRRSRGSRTGGIERTRTHHVVASPPVDDAYDDLAGDWSPVDHWIEPEYHGPRRAGMVDPRLLRIGAVVVAAVLAIPIAMAMRSEP